MTGEMCVEEKLAVFFFSTCMLSFAGALVISFWFEAPVPRTATGLRLFW